MARVKKLSAAALAFLKAAAEGRCWEEVPRSTAITYPVILENDTRQFPSTKTRTALMKKRLIFRDRSGGARDYYRLTIAGMELLNNPTTKP